MKITMNLLMVTHNNQGDCLEGGKAYWKGNYNDFLSNALCRLDKGIIYPNDPFVNYFVISSVTPNEPVKKFILSNLPKVSLQTSFIFMIP
ncbi:hypothetical protein SIN01_20440 [Sporolactobacillus inulinus]|nr:hypothetical protein SIN01_20440 [Sporolactobacillus inulinus]